MRRCAWGLWLGWITLISSVGFADVSEPLLTIIGPPAVSASVGDVWEHYDTGLQVVPVLAQEASDSLLMVRWTITGVMPPGLRWVSGRAATTNISGATCTIVAPPPVQSIYLRGSPIAAGKYQLRIQAELYSGVDGKTIARSGEREINFTVSARWGEPTATPANELSPSSLPAATPSSLNVRAEAGEKRPQPGRLVNLSVHGNAGVGFQLMTLGLTIGGSGEIMPVLLRVMGPSLAAFGRNGYLTNPILSFCADGVSLGTNDDWNDDPRLRSATARVGAFPFLGATSQDAALHWPALPRGVYTAQVSASADDSGIVLAEIFDTRTAAVAARAGTRFVNLSALATVGSGHRGLIAGFVIGGETACSVLFRAAGPALAVHRVAGVLANPQIRLFRAEAELASNDDWDAASTPDSLFRAVGAFPFAPGSKDAALKVSLDPGAYVVQVTGLTSDTGVALLELYEVADVARGAALND